MCGSSQKAKPSKVRVVANILAKFCAASGMKISLEKSKVFASKGMTPRRKQKISNISHIAFNNHMGKYLGII